MDKVKWGIMSTAGIGATKVIPAMQKGSHCDIQGLASRSLEKADALAAKLNIPRTFGSYEELLDCAEIEIPFNAPPDQPCKMWLQTQDQTEEINFPVCDQYTIQGDLFSRAILENTDVPTPLEDAVANMKVIDALVESARSGAWV